MASPKYQSSSATKLIVPSTFKQHQNRFETQVVGHGNQARHDVVTYDGKIDWSLRYHHPTNPMATINTTNSRSNLHQELGKCAQWEAKPHHHHRVLSYEEPQALGHYRIIGKRQSTTNENAQFRQGLRNHSYISPTHMSNKALYGNDVDTLSQSRMIKNENLVVRSLFITLSSLLIQVYHNTTGRDLQAPNYAWVAKVLLQGQRMGISRISLRYLSAPP